MKFVRLSLIALVMSGCLVLCLFGPQPTEAEKATRCEVANRLLDINKAQRDWNCILEFKKIFNTTEVGKKRGRGLRYEQILLRGKDYCIALMFGGECDVKCEDRTGPINVISVKCSSKGYRFEAWGG